jgi:hypothetical protein
MGQLKMLRTGGSDTLTAESTRTNSTAIVVELVRDAGLTIRFFRPVFRLSQSPRGVGSAVMISNLASAGDSTVARTETPEIVRMAVWFASEKDMAA